MVAYTTLLKIRKPTVGGDADAWGGHLNDGMDILDLIFLMLQPSGHRLTLTTAVPVTTSDVTAAAMLYCTPDKSRGIANFDGAYWTLTDQAELSMALDSDGGHAGYHQSGKLFDVFYFDDSGTKRIGTGPAWTNDTTRASAISRLNGVYVNTSSMTVRFGSASGNTVTLAANRGTYLGTIYCTANGQTEDSLAKRMVWNCYNRRPRAMKRVDTTDNWTYTTAAFRQVNAAAANQFDMVRGLDEDVATVEVTGIMSNTSAPATVAMGIGLDSTSVDSSTVKPIAQTQVSGTLINPSARYAGFPGLGRHYLAWLEYSGASGTSTWFGDNGGSLMQSGMTGQVMA